VELAEAKHRISRLQDLQTQVDSTWRGSRWIMDVLSLARERTVTVGVAISAFSHQNRESEAVPEDNALNRGLMAIKTEPGRSNKRVLLKAKSDNKIQCSLSPTSSDDLVRTQVCFHSNFHFHLIMSTVLLIC